MAHKPPSEKIIEELFVAYAYLYLNVRPKFFAPSQVQEKKFAYDAKFGVNGCREIYLQFKSAKLRAKPKRLTLSLGLGTKKKAATELEQLHNLQTLYPVGSSYYVVPRFWDLGAVLTANDNASPREFLDNYIAIPAHSIRLRHVDSSHEPDVWSPYLPFLLGHQLFDLFEAGKLGALVEKPTKSKIRRTALLPSNPQLGLTEDTERAARLFVGRLRDRVPSLEPSETEEGLMDIASDLHPAVFRMC